MNESFRPLKRRLQQSFLAQNIFELITDHNSLHWLHSMKPKGQIAQWVIDLHEFDFTISHKSSCLHTNVGTFPCLLHSHDLTNLTLATMPMAEQTHDAKITSLITVDTTLSLCMLQGNDSVIMKVIE